MKNLIERLLFVCALVFVALALGAQPAFASDVDVADTSGFGAQVGPTITLPLLVAGQWSATLTESVFVSGGVYTYVFTIANGSIAPTAPLSQFTTATIGLPNVDNFISSLNFGVVTGAAFTTPAAGIDDGSGGCTIGGFCFGTSSLTFQPTSAADTGHLPAGDKITFYAQGGAPVLGTFGAQDGGTNNFVPSLDPGPEPGSILLFGTGLLTFGVILRRRLPQLLQPR